MCFCVYYTVVHQEVFKANLSNAICTPQTTARHSRTPCVSEGFHTPVKGKSWVNLWFHFNHIDLWPFWVKTITSFEVKRKDIARGVTKAFWLNSMTIQYLVQEMPLWKSWILFTYSLKVVVTNEKRSLLIKVIIKNDNQQVFVANEDSRTCSPPGTYHTLSLVNECRREPLKISKM